MPDDITRNSGHIRWETILDWYAAYAGCSQMIHLSVSIDDLNIHNVEIVIKPDLSDISLHVINTCQLAPDFRSVLEPQYHILEDHTLVFEVYVEDDESRIYIRSMSSPLIIISPESPIFLKLSVHDLVVVADFLKYV